MWIFLPYGICLLAYIPMMFWHKLAKIRVLGNYGRGIGHVTVHLDTPCCAYIFFAHFGIFKLFLHFPDRDKSEAVHKRNGATTLCRDRAKQKRRESNAKRDEDEALKTNALFLCKGCVFLLQ